MGGLCPHCERATGSAKHAEHCLDNPTVHAKIAAYIVDPDNPGYAISSNRYARGARAAGVVAAKTLGGHYGSWVKAVKAFGLLVPKTGRRGTGLRRYNIVPQAYAKRVEACSYCGRECTPGNIVRHVNSCVLRPGVMERVRELVQDDEPGVGVDSGEYRRRLDEWHKTAPAGIEPLPAVGTLEYQFGGWPNVLKHLELVSWGDVVDAKTKADNDRYRRAWREAHAAELEPRGLPVASVRRLENGGTAVTIR